MCLTPIQLEKETWKQKISVSYHRQQVPCGRCLECLQLRVNSWFVRLKEQKKVSKSSHFITLTYDDDNLPYTHNGLLTLKYTDVQEFYQKIRNCYNYRAKDAKTGKSKVYTHPEGKFKYFTVGEYGSKTHRPHYHAIVFDLSPEKIEEKWQKGHVHIAPAEDATLYYTLKYALKRAGKIRKCDIDDDRVIEKALMSKGLGESFLTPEMIKYYKDDVTRPITLLDNAKLPLPRYYRDKIFTDSEKLERNKKLIQDLNEERFDTISDPLFPQRVKKNVL